MSNESPVIPVNLGRSGSLVRRYLACGLIVFIVVSSMSRPVQAADGDLDATFGSGGKVTTDFFGSFDAASAVAIQRDGKIIVARTATRIINADFTFDFALVRYNIDGSLDPTFGSTGKVTTDFFNSSDSAKALAIQIDGKIVVAGNIDNSDFALARYNSDGSLDTTFGLGGKVTTNFGAIDTVSAVALQTDGKIIVVGGAGDSTRLALARYSSDGSLDSTFGSGGRVLTQVSDFTQFAYAVALQPDGKIIIAGVAVNAGTSYDFVLVRYYNDGSVDITFGSSGKAVTDFFNGDDLASDLVIQSDGRIIVSGSVKTSTSFDATYDFGLARYKSDGSLDTTFGSGGKGTTDFFNRNDRPSRMAIQKDGRIVIVGFATKNDTDSDFALARYNNLVFDICIQDDSNRSYLKMNSFTGDYQKSGTHWKEHS